jgi:hypothetical protein
MKRFTLLPLLLLFPLFSFSQIAKVSPGKPQAQSETTGFYQSSPLKAGGDIIWETTFNWANPQDQQGWTLPEGWEIRDNADLGNNWIWLGDSIKGRFTNLAAPANFTSKSDGFICVPMDYYNYRDGFETNNASDTYIMTPPINCSGRPSVVVKLNQFYRFCCENNNTGHLQLMVTNDNGVHWATYDLSYGIGHNTFTPVRYQAPEFNISDVAAGMANVRIKIYFHEVPYYFWAIDDLRLCEAYENDLKLEDTWPEVNGGYDSPIGHINYLPFSQIGMTGEGSGKVGDFTFRGAMLNNGMADAEDARLNAIVLRNGTEYYTKSSPVSTIWPLERDTMEISDPLSPAEYGDYKVTLSAAAVNNEETPADNSATYYFTINDSLFQRADMSAESAINTGVWANGNSAGDLMIVRYDIKTDIEVNSIAAKIQSFTPSVNPSFQFVLFRYSPEEDDFIEVMTTDVITMDSSKLGFITVPLSKDGESEFLHPGQYYTGFRAWADGGVPGMRLGWDQNARAEFTNYNLIYLTSISTWYGSDKLPIMGLNLNNHSGPSEAPVTFNVDMTRHIASGEFHPGTDFVDVAGTFNNWTGSAHMTDADGDGIFTVTINNAPVGINIEYKYRINGNWGTSEYMGGQPNRTYMVRYWNIISDIYNGGIAAGTPEINNSTTISVYPNPSNGAFNLQISNSNPGLIKLTITNLQGQICYSKTYTDQSYISEIIDLKSPAGLYFLRIDDASGSNVTKLIIQ